MLKKVALLGLVVIVFSAFVVKQRFFDDDEVNIVAPVQTTSVQGSNPSALDPGSSLVQEQVRGKFKDGSYTGAVADAFYGNVQVTVVVSNGKISDVIFLDYPKDRGTSRRISEQAMPILKQEAITVQSASVDTVTGATQTSRAFKESLQSALDKAI